VPDAAPGLDPRPISPANAICPAA